MYGYWNRSFIMATSMIKVPSIQAGPSGRAVAEQMDSDLLSAFQHHLNMERQAHTVYFAAALWCAERELRGFTQFFRDESLSELQHSAKFADFLITRGQTVELHDLPAPKQHWTMPVDLMEMSFQMEVDVTTSLQQLYAFAERHSDTRTTVFLDPMIEKQTQSEHEFAHLLGRVRFADNQATALLLIDNELEQGKFQPVSLQTKAI